VRIAIDVMGGDHAPDAILAGALDSVDLLQSDDQIVLVGEGRVIRPALSQRGLDNDDRFEVVETTQIIEMGEPPIQALRSKPDSSLVRMAELGSKKAGDKRCDVVISAGNTGACVAAAQMAMRRLPGVHRPGVAVPIPTFHGPIVLCDVGANPEPRPTHIHQYAHMAGVYANRVLGVENPRVALMSIGGEEGKGNILTRETHKLMKADTSLNYVGYVEGRDLFSNKADVVATEGFTGNVVIKLAEGLAAGLFQTIMHEVMEVDPNLAAQFKPVIKRIYANHDYHEFGGAPLLGANGVCMICHGSSEARTITSSVKAAMNYMRHGVNDGIIEALSNQTAAEVTA
jgi:phosphate acyltransferase